MRFWRDPPTTGRSFLLLDHGGNAGKSTYMNWKMDNDGCDTGGGCLIVDPGKQADVFHAMKNYTHLLKTLFIDVPRAKLDYDEQMMFVVEQVKNRRFMSPKYDSGFLKLVHPVHVVMARNALPNPDLMSPDRCIVMQITQGGWNYVPQRQQKEMWNGEHPDKPCFINAGDYDRAGWHHKAPPWCKTDNVYQQLDNAVPTGNVAIQRAKEKRRERTKQLEEWGKKQLAKKLVRWVRRCITHGGFIPTPTPIITDGDDISVTSSIMADAVRIEAQGRALINTKKRKAQRSLRDADQTFRERVRNTDSEGRYRPVPQEEQPLQAGQMVIDNRGDVRAGNAGQYAPGFNPPPN